MKRSGYIISIFFIALFLFGSCSAKKKSRSSTPSRVKVLYHDITARDNGYFNAKLKFNTSIKKLAAQHKDNYEEILPLDKFGTKDDRKTFSSDMDEIIKKSSAVIQFKKTSKWIDDSYLLIGKANYFKSELDNSILTFQYITQEFKEGIRNVETKKDKKKSSSVKKGKKKKGKKKGKKRKKRKRKKKKKSSSSAKESSSNAKKGGKSEEDKVEKKGFLHFIKHKPIKEEAFFWLIRSYIDIGKYTEADILVAMARGNKEMPKKLRDNLEKIHTYLFLQQQEYQKAISPLKRCIELTKNKKIRTRYTFILAQIYQKLGNKRFAQENFEKVLKLNPDYEMEYYAKINLARSYDAESGGSSKEIRRILNKLVRSDRYEEFRDQIYYALAEVALKEKNVPEAIEYLNLSVTSSMQNEKQKGLSHLKLAELYFDRENYVYAHKNYQKAATFLPKEYEDYDEIRKMNDILRELVANINIVQREDSLQRIAAMPENERDNYITKVIEKMKRKEYSSYGTQGEGSGDQGGFPGATTDGTDGGEGEGEGAQMPGNTTAPILSASKGSVWYFYNPGAKSRGIVEFRNTWGNLALKDDWRRSNKKEEMGGEEQFMSEFGSEENKILEGYNLEDIILQLPISESDKKVSNDKIIQALYNMGDIYKSKLKNYPKAIETFESLLDRFPNNTFRLQALYNLYLLYDNATASPGKRNSCKQSILSEFPESIFAKLIMDPDYLLKAKSENKELQDYYEITYNFFTSGKYWEVLKRKKTAARNYPDNFLQPKFDLLEALAIGKVKKQDVFEKALIAITEKYPDDEVKLRAEELLYFLNPKKYKLGKGSNLAKYGKSDPREKYTYDEKAIHYLGILFLTSESNITKKVSGGLSNYNRVNHSLDNLKLSKMLYEEGKQLLLVKRFTNKKKAFSYYEDILANKSIFKGITSQDYKVFIISKKNFSYFYSKKDLKNYSIFFEENYKSE